MSNNVKRTHDTTYEWRSEPRSPRAQNQSPTATMTLDSHLSTSRWLHIGRPFLDCYTYGHPDRSRQSGKTFQAPTLLPPRSTSRADRLSGCPLKTQYGSDTVMLPSRLPAASPIAQSPLFVLATPCVSLRPRAAAAKESNRQGTRLHRNQAFV